MREESPGCLPTGVGKEWEIPKVSRRFEDDLERESVEDRRSVARRGRVKQGVVLIIEPCGFVGQRFRKSEEGTEGVG